MMYMYLSADNPHIRYVKSLLCALVKIITKLINIVLSVLHAVWYPCGALPLSLYPSRDQSWFTDGQLTGHTNRQRDGQTETERRTGRRTGTAVRKFSLM